jgi:hypothetical protein
LQSSWQPNLGCLVPETEPAALLDEVGALRKRTRRERQGYWFPFVLFGVLILVAPLVYAGWPGGLADDVDPLVVHLGGITFRPFGLLDEGPFPFSDPLATIVYWMAVLVVGTLLTVGWYQWRATRVGLQPRVLTHVLWVLAAVLVCALPVPYLTVWAFGLFHALSSAPLLWTSIGVLVLGGLVAALGVRGERSVMRRVVLVIGVVLMLIGCSVIAGIANTHGFGALLVLSIAVLGIAWMERSVWCAIVAFAFTGAALLANLYNMENVFLGYPASTFASVFVNLALPGVVLLVGGIVALLMGRSTR